MDVIKEENVNLFLAGSNTMIDINMNKDLIKKNHFCRARPMGGYIDIKKNDTIYNLPNKKLRNEKAWEKYLEMIASTTTESNSETKVGYNMHFNIPECEELNNSKNI